MARKKKKEGKKEKGVSCRGENPGCSARGYWFQS